MTPSDRRREIVAIVRQKGRASVDELAAALGASRETIRRDLADLAGRGLVQKYHGGAAIPAGEGPFLVRMGEQAAEKARIARAAVRLIAPGDTLFLDTGSTTVYFAEELARVENLTVFTNSTKIAHVLGRVENGARVFLPGGEYNAANRQMIGALAVEHIRGFHARHAVLTIGALDARDGAMDFNVDEAEVARAMIGQADAVTILADATKLGHAGVFGVCAIDRIDNLVTDRPPRGDLAAALARAGVNVIVAE